MTTNIFDPPEILWFHSDKSGCGTYRCYVPALTLQERGWDNNFCQHSQIDVTNLRRWEAEVAMNKVVVFQRAFGSHFLAIQRYCHSHGVKVVIEMDDDLWHIPKSNPAYWYWAGRDAARMLRKQIELADHVIVSTQPLKAAVCQQTGRDAADITVCANHLHPHEWGKARFEGEQPYDNETWTVIGWQGSQTHDTDFREAIPAIARILQERPKVLVRFFGSVPLTIRGKIPETRFQWARGVPFEFYPPALYRCHFDIGIAPVTDSTFNRSKSNLKYLEYSALGIPCVASKVYPYARTIRHGETGFVAGTTEEWYAALLALVDDPNLRQTMGTAAHDAVWREWGDTHATAWETVFQSLVGRPYAAAIS